MRFGSVCSGIEAASVAWFPLGWDAAWLAEVDVAASQVLAHRLGATAPVFPMDGTEQKISRLNWGDRITNWGDMTRVAEMIRVGEAEAPDVLCGGTPCQSFSVAGARRGLEDARGNLALSFIQLADAIDERRAAEGKEPCIVIFENVPGLLSSKDNAFGCFLGALAGEVLPLVPSGRKWTNAGVVLGPERAIAWRIGDAQYHGLAQRRRRIFVVASAREGFDPAGILLEFEGLRRDSAPSREAWQEVAGTLDARTDGGGFPGSDGAAQYHVVPHGLGSDRPDGPVGLVPTWWDGSPVSQTLDAVLHKGQTMPEKNRFPAVLQPVGCDVADTLTVGANQMTGFIGDVVAHPVQSVALRGRDGGATAELGGEAAYALRAANGGGSDPYVLAPLTTFQTRGSNIDVDEYVTGTIGSNCDRASGSAPMIAFSCKDYGADATEDIAPTMLAMGHSGSHANAGGQLAVCVTGEITHTLKAEGFDASEDGTGRGQPIVTHYQEAEFGVAEYDTAGTLRAGRIPEHEMVVNHATMAVRRLMPIECHRLQGFPDVLEWKFDEMTRDEVILAALINGDIIVDAERGKVFGTRGPGGIALSEPRELGCSTPNGYRVANLTANGVKRQVRLHRVVWMSVYGVIPEGFVPDHINNDKADNRIANLQLLTSGENSTKAKEDGLYDFDDAAHTKLTAEVRAQVWCDYHSGRGTYKELAAMYGVSPSRIGQIATQEPWCAVPTGPKGDKIAADGPQYKQLGNSWAVNHARWVGYRIAAWVEANPSQTQKSAEPMSALWKWALVD